MTGWLYDMEEPECFRGAQGKGEGGGGEGDDFSIKVLVRVQARHLGAGALRRGKKERKKDSSQPCPHRRLRGVPAAKSTQREKGGGGKKGGRKKKNPRLPPGGEVLNGAVRTVKWAPGWRKKEEGDMKKISGEFPSTTTPESIRQEGGGGGRG